MAAKKMGNNQSISSKSSAVVCVMLTFLGLEFGFYKAF